MQTETDREKMISIGVDAQKVKTLGNLKYDLQTPKDHSTHSADRSSCFPNDISIIVAGSTHEGEEAILFSALHSIKKDFPTIQLILAPKDIGRSATIEALAKEKGFSVARRTLQINNSEDVFILDTLGELFQAYQNCDIAFVGGSLVEQEGHNPIEPASCGIPVLFGQHMNDFEEVSHGLLQVNGATSVATAKDFTKEVLTLLNSPDLCKNRGQAAKNFIIAQQGVVKKHLEIIQDLL